ncbi:MAG TPA: transporter substrate-binding domain-containing protein [Methylocella sp.]|nr:transporter substrate-binding domain-containing protein [Methylocella sp.]
MIKANPRPVLLEAAFLLVALVPAAAAGTTLDGVRAKGTLACGLIRAEADYSKNEDHGDLSLFGADFCRAVAAAVLGEAQKIRILSFPDEPAGLKAVGAGEVALAVGATPDAVSGKAFSVGFGSPVFDDGQGFLVNRQDGIASLSDLAGKPVCFIANTSAETGLGTLTARGIRYRPFPFEERGEMEAALVTGHCAAMTGDVSMLAVERIAFHARAKDYVILPETIRQDPFAPAFRQGDAQWAAIVNGVTAALREADAKGITRASAVTMAHNTGDPTAKQLLGPGHDLGLDDLWAARVITAVGNYGEMFDRDLGENSPLRLTRGKPFTE